MSDFEDSIRYFIKSTLRGEEINVDTKSRIFQNWKNSYEKNNWTRTIPDKETPRFKKIKMLLLNDAVDIEPINLKTKTWYQVYKPGKTYGFSVINGIIQDHPERRFEGFPFDINKASFEVVKIADQIIL